MSKNQKDTNNNINIDEDKGIEIQLNDELTRELPIQIDENNIQETEMDEVDLLIAKELNSLSLDYEVILLNQ